MLRLLLSSVLVLAAAGCDLYGASDCPCPSEYVCCEGQGLCVLQGESCDGFSDPDPSPPPPPPRPADDVDRSDWTCCSGVCTPPGMECDGWNFVPLGFDSIDEFRAVLEKRWIGVRHVPWTEDFRVTAEFSRNEYHTECLDSSCVAFYWGYEEPGVWHPYRFTAINLDGSMEGYTTVVFTPDIGTIREGRTMWSFNAARDRLRIQMWNSWTDPAIAPSTLYLIADPGQ